MIPQHACGIGDGLVRGREHTALAGRNHLARVEGEATRATEGPGVSRPNHGSQPAGRIFHYPQPVPLRDPHDRPHVSAQPKQMNWDNAYGSRRD